MIQVSLLLFSLIEFFLSKGEYLLAQVFDILLTLALYHLQSLPFFFLFIRFVCFISQNVAAHLFDVVALRLTLSTLEDELELSLRFLGFLHYQVLLNNVRLTFAFDGLLFDFFHVKAFICDMFEVAVHGLSTILKHKDFVGLLEELELLGDKDYALIGKRALDCLVEDEVGRVCVD